MNKSEPVVAFSTVDSEKEAKKIAKALVEGRLAACVNIVPQITSVYEWQGEICEEGEFLLVIKTRSERLDELKAALEELHPYDVPELIACPIIDGLPDYLKWVMENTK